MLLHKRRLSKTINWKSTVALGFHAPFRFLATLKSGITTDAVSERESYNDADGAEEKQDISYTITDVYCYDV